MNFGSIDPWMFAAGLGFFLFGMRQLEVGLKIVGGGWLETTLRRSTGHPLGSITVGIIATAILQSSSLVGLMVLAFVGADILRMRNAVGVILGTNLGTTFTGWLVTAIGFKLDLEGLALPIIAIGMLGTVALERRAMARGTALVLLGLGLLLYGLSFMKDSVEVFAASLDLSALTGLHAYWFFVTGFVFAAVIQSSSATMMITLSALHAGIVDLPSAAAIAIGADLGTTSTLMIGSLRATAAGKQVALAHFLYNLVTAAIALFILLPVLEPGLRLVGLTDPLFGLVAFHSFFNLLGIFIFLPLIDPFSRFLERRFVRIAPGRAQYLGKTPPQIDTAALAALEAESVALLRGVIALNRRCFRLEGPASSGWTMRFGNHNPSYEEAYATLKQIEGEVLDYARRTQTLSQSDRVAARIEHLLMAVRDGIYSAKSIKDIRANLVEFRHLEQDGIRAYVERLTMHMRGFYSGLEAIVDSDETVAAERTDDLQRVDGEFMRTVTQDFYRDESTAALTDLQTSTFLNVLREVDSADRALIRAVQALNQQTA